MIFFSQLLRAPIYDSKDEVVGRLKDVVVSTKDGEYPTVRGVIFQDGKHCSFIPYQCIKR